MSGLPLLHPSPSKAVSWLVRWEQLATVFAVDRAGLSSQTVQGQVGSYGCGKDCCCFSIFSGKGKTQPFSEIFFIKPYISLQKMKTGSALNLS